MVVVPDPNVAASAIAYLRSGGGILPPGRGRRSPANDVGQATVVERGHDPRLIARIATFIPPSAGGLSPAEVIRLRNAIDEAKMAQARISPSGARAVDTRIRDSSVQWVSAEHIGEEIFAHLYTLASVANSTLGWSFVVRRITPHLQLTKYSSDGYQHYDWHMDWGLGRTCRRKITVVAHLSDDSAFEGGELQLRVGAMPISTVQSAGTVTIFPAFLMHRVTPVVSGVRYGVVAWVLGPSFR
jgi:PKHD-type hydroxylase